MVSRGEAVEVGSELGAFEELPELSLLSFLRQNRELTASINRLPSKLLEMTERELEAQVSPNREQRLLKIAFWDEYRRAQRQGSTAQMNITNICHGICHRKYFYQKIADDPYMLAWIISPPAEEMIIQKELLRIGYQRLAEVLDLPFVEKQSKFFKGQIIVNEKVNVSLIKEVRAIVEQLQNRVYGAVIQRQQIEAKTLNVSVPAKTEMSMEDLTKALKQLEKIEKTLPALPDVTDAEVLDEGI